MLVIMKVLTIILQVVAMNTDISEVEKWANGHRPLNKIR